MEGQWERRHLGVCLGFPYTYLFRSNNQIQTQPVAPLTSGNPIGLGRFGSPSVTRWDSRKVAWGWQAKLPSDKNWRLGALRSSRLPSPSPKRTSRSRHCLSFFHQCRCSPTVITCLCSLSPETCLAPLVQHPLSTTLSCSFTTLYRPSILNPKSLGFYFDLRHGC